jgi:hypothetical protein
VVPHLIAGGASHLQYVNDTMIMIEPRDAGIKNLKILLISFKNRLGPKRNFDKNKVVVTGA